MLQLWAEDPLKGNAAIDAVMTDMRRIDVLMSHYKPDSQLSRINAHANSEAVQVDKELFDLIKLSTHYSQITEGAFDITYASVGYLYDYRHRIRPTEQQITKALPGVKLAQTCCSMSSITPCASSIPACALTWAASARATPSIMVWRS